MAEVSTLATFLADPEVEQLWGQVGASLAGAYYEGVALVGASRMVGSIKALLNVERADKGAPRHDLIGAAPWIFEAPATAFTGLSRDSGLFQLNQLGAMKAPIPRPSSDGDDPLGLWLRRVDSDTDLPEEFSVDMLQKAFRTLRFRLKSTDLRTLVERDSIGRSAKIIHAAHADSIDHLRSFDIGGGGDEAPTRIAIQMERFARACAQHRAEAFVSDLVFRTGLPRQEIGRVLTMMLRAAIEFFVYFRALWSFSLSQAYAS
jgi:hypothetical protein